MLSMMIHALMALCLSLTNANNEAPQLSQPHPDALAFDIRESELTRLGVELNKLMSKHSRVVRKGNNNSYLENLIVRAVRASEARLKKRGGYVLRTSGGEQSSRDKHFSLTAFDFQKLFLLMDPYRREYIESTLNEKNVVGALLMGRAFKWNKLPEKLANTSFIDLEKFEKTGDSKLDKKIQEAMKVTGSRFYLLILPEFDLPSALYKPTDLFAVEQTRDGSLNIFQERSRPRQSDVMGATIIEKAPRNLLFVPKSELPHPLTEQTKIHAFVVDTFSAAENL